jgi:hypothetical protein
MKTICPNCSTQSEDKVCPNCGFEFVTICRKCLQTYRLTEKHRCPNSSPIEKHHAENIYFDCIFKKSAAENNLLILYGLRQHQDFLVLNSLDFIYVLTGDFAIGNVKKLNDFFDLKLPIKRDYNEEDIKNIKIEGLYNIEYTEKDGFNKLVKVHRVV